MGSSAQKSALIICGDYMEDCEVIVPFFMLQALGVRVDCVSPGKVAGDKLFTAIHDYMGFELYTELQGHFFVLNANFDEVKPESYDTLIIPGGRFTELLSVNNKVIKTVEGFAVKGKPIATSCHSQLMLIAAGLLKSGKKCTAFTSLKPVIELAGGTWWEQPGVQSVLDLDKSLCDGNLISSIGWPAFGDFMNILLQSMGAKISRSKQHSVLVLLADYVEDYEGNVPLRALQGLGCKVDTACPSKKKGEFCISAIHDDEAAQICSEKRGHNFFVTVKWSDISVDNYDCLVLPGGRSPELLAVNESAISLVKQFVEKDKIVAAIGQGNWILAAANILKGKKCASNAGTDVIVKVAGGEVVESEQCVTHGKLVTATGWQALPVFLSQLFNVLGLTVAF